MNLRPNSLFHSIAATLASKQDALLRPWAGDCWRFQVVTFPSGADILSGKGAVLHGGRWNAPGSVPVVYGSTLGTVALQESEAHDRYYGMVTRQPRIYVCIRLKLDKILDLSNPAVLDALQLAAADLRAEDWRKLQAGGHESLTQCIGRAASQVGAEGLLTSSASVESGLNIAYFPENKGAGSEVELCDGALIDEMLRKNRD